MKQRIFKAILTFMIAFIMVFSPSVAYAVPLEDTDVPTFEWLETLFSNSITAVTYLIGTAAFCAILWGGFQYLTSVGNREKAAAGKQGITYAIFAVFGILILWYVLLLINQVTGAKVLEVKFQL